MMIDASKIFNYQNPWRKNRKFKISPFFDRFVISSIMEWMSEPEILILIGPRQSGKTTILYRIIEIMLNRGTAPERIFFFNCDELPIQSLLGDTVSFLKFLEQKNSGSSPIIFIDEIQRLNNPGLFLKQLFDLKMDLKFIVSGSSSLEIRSQIKESLTGRKIVFPVLPFNFLEFLQRDEELKPIFKTEPQKIITEYEIFNKIWGARLQSDFEQFLIFGGYPRVIRSQKNDQKERILKEIYSSYIKKDISDFMKIENISGFNNLVKFLAITNGQLINKSEISLKARLAALTLEKYLQILQDTFVIEKISPFFSNLLKEIVKNPKYYFLDNGLRNSILNNFAPTDFREDSGFLQETFTLNELKSIDIDLSDIKFWRTKPGAEVDFVLVPKNEVIPIECKTLLRRPVLGKSFISFVRKYSPKKGIILNANLFSETKIGKTKVYFVPYHWFPLIKKELLK